MYGAIAIQWAPDEFEHHSRAPSPRRSPTIYRSHAESYGFFTDVRDADWCRLKERAYSTPNHAIKYKYGVGNGKAEQPNKWYQNNWEPTFTCLGEERQGMGDGPKWICDPYRLRSKKPCIVYSMGSANEFSFEENIHRNIGSHCEIHTFDPTTFGGNSNKPPYVHFHAWGLDGSTHGRYKTLQRITQELGHRNVDIFKIDCEGCEWKTFMHWFNYIQPVQVLVELHSGTTGASPVPAERFMRYMRKHGYAVFHKEPNTVGCKGACIEYAFVRLAPKFWNTRC